MSGKMKYSSYLQILIFVVSKIFNTPLNSVFPERNLTTYQQHGAYIMYHHGPWSCSQHDPPSISLRKGSEDEDGSREAANKFIGIT